MSFPVFHVVPAHDGWRVDREGEGSGAELFATREEALEAARAQAATCRPCMVRVHQPGGTVEAELEFLEPAPG